MIRQRCLTLIATIIGGTAAGVGIRNPRREGGPGDDDAFPSAPPGPGGTPITRKT